MRMGEDADLRIGQDKPAQQIVLQVTFDRRADRFFRQTSPGFAIGVVVIESSPEILFRHKRLQHRIPGLFCEHAGEPVELFQLLVFRIAAGQFENRLPARFLRNVAQKQTSVLAVLLVGGKRRRSPAGAVPDSNRDRE